MAEGVEPSYFPENKLLFVSKKILFQNKKLDTINKPLKMAKGVNPSNYGDLT